MVGTVLGDRNGTDRPQPTLVGLVTAGAGIVGYVYAMGAASLYLELWVAGLPKGEALDEFTSRRFVLIGAVVAAAAALLTVLLAVVIRRLARPRAPVVTAAPAAGGAAAPDAAPAAAPEAGGAAGASGAAAAAIRPARHAARAFQRQEIWQKSLVLGAVATLLAWLIVNTLIIHLSLRLASVQTPSGCVSGIYISSDAEGVHLADGVSDRLLLIPTSEVRSVSIGVKRTVSGQPIRRCSAAEQAATDLRALSSGTVAGG
jgi:hypothetical protein